MDVTITAAIIGVLGVIGVVLIPYLHRTLTKKIRVKRIKSYEHPDLGQALALYPELMKDKEENIRHNVLDTGANIVRWLKEVEEETRQKRCKLDDYFLVAKVKKRICGLLYAHYYRSSSLMFISYIAADKKVPETLESAATTKLLGYLSRKLRKSLRDCEGVVFEVEPSRGERNGPMETFRRLALQQGVPVREIRVNYRQPKLSLENKNYYKEQKIALMYGRTREPKLEDKIRHIPRIEAEKVLGFVYKEIYADQFERFPEYQNYMNELYKEITSRLTDQVPLDEKRKKIK